MKLASLFIWILALAAGFFFACCGGDDTEDTVDCGNDTLCQQCEEQTTDPGPRCYQEALLVEEDPDRCSNISDYWGESALGMEGTCFYEIMRVTGDCSLCDQIEEPQVKSMCDADCA